jgi:hypothetical protein
MRQSKNKLADKLTSEEIEERRAKLFRPVPGKPAIDPQNRIVTVKRYGTDSAGEYVEVQLAGSYGAHVRLPISCIRPLTDNDRKDM